MHTFCAEISGHGSECRSSERLKLALIQPITYGMSNDTLNLYDARMIFSRHLPWPITYIGSVVLVARTAGKHEKNNVIDKSKKYSVSKISRLSIYVPGTRTCPGGPSCLHVFDCELQESGALCTKCSLFHAKHVNLKSKVILFSSVTFVLPQNP